MDPKLSTGLFSHRLRAGNSKCIFLPSVEQEKKFLEAAKTELRKNRRFWLLVTDLSQYFETIRFPNLKRQLDGLLRDVGGGPALKECVATLIRCLSEWSPYDKYGLPQNHDASSFLGNAMLDGTDKLMERAGYRILRYMDDIRIVVGSEADARKALMMLVACLRDIGLGLNSAKTDVLAPDSQRIEEYLPVAHADVTTIELAIGTKDRAQVQGIVELLFQKANALLACGKVGDRVFRFCLNRIVSLRRYRNLDLPDVLVNGRYSATAPEAAGRI